MATCFSAITAKQKQPSQPMGLRKVLLEVIFDRDNGRPDGVDRELIERLFAELATQEDSS